MALTWGLSHNLLPQTFPLRPLLIQSTIEYTKNLKHSSCDLLTCWYHALVFSLMSATPGGAYHYLIFFSNQVFDSDGNIRKARTHHSNVVFDTLCPWRLVGC